MATTKINLFPLSLAALIVFSLLFIAAVSANVVPQQKPKPRNNYYNKNADADVDVNANATPPPPPPTASTKKTYVVPGKRKNAKFVSDFVSAHNTVRLLIGHEPMTWNYTIAYFAKQWAKKRVDDCDLTHSFGPYGENLFWGGRTHWSPSAVVKSWAEEKAFYDPKSNSCAEGQMCGHYTQIVWQDTVRVGCARVKCNNNKGLYVICNYDPPGNYLNEHPFGNLANAAGNLLKNLQPPLPSKKNLSVIPKPIEIGE